MTKITRKDQQIFASTAGDEAIAKFGSLAAGSPGFSTDPDEIQTNEYKGGWESAVIGQASPAMEDRNALDYLYARQLGYLYQQGIAEYSATQTYFKGSVVSSFDAGEETLKLYYSLIDDNTGNSLEDDTKWVEFKSGGGGGADLPILTFQFTDHELNSVSWAKSNFSWMDGTVYLAAYKHLRNDLGFRYASSILTVSHSDYTAGNYVRISTLDTQISSTDYYAWGISGETDPTKCIFTLTTTLADSVKVFAYKNSTTIYQLTSGIVESKTENVGGTTITYYRAQDGHKIVLDDQATNVASIYSATGIAWYYIFDDTNTRFKLPRSNWNFKATSNDDAGDFVDQSLPNIKGSINMSVPVDGAFGSQSYTETNYTFANSATSYRVTFDASGSSSVYQDSANVQEKATKAYLYFFVGNFEQSAIEQTAGLAQENFTAKADVDLFNTPAKDICIAMYTNGNDWYRIYRSGWCEQGGLSVGTGSYGLKAITFHKKFSLVTFAWSRIVWSGADSWYTNTAALQCTSGLDIMGVPDSVTGTGMKISGCLDHVWYACGYIDQSEMPSES